MEADRLAAEQAEAERVAALEAKRVAALQEQERVTAQLAEEQRREIEEREQRRQAALRAQQERIAAQRAEKERIAAERAEWERQARERATKATAPQAPGRAAASAALADGAPAVAPPAKPAATPPSGPDVAIAAARAAGAVDVPVTPPADAAPRTAPPDRRGAGSEPIPRFIEFRPGSLLQYVFGALFTIFSVGAVIAIFWAVSDGRGNAILAAACLTALSMVSWWALLNWSPPVVSISNGVLEVARGSKAQSWDLRDPSTQVTVRGRPSSPAWRAVLEGKGGKSVAITARMVDAAQFTEVVDHYRSLGPDAENQ